MKNEANERAKKDKYHCYSEVLNGSESKFEN